MAHTKTSQRWLLLGATLSVVSALATSEPTPIPANLDAWPSVITRAATPFDSRHGYLLKKNIMDDIKSRIHGAVHSLDKDITGWFDKIPLGTGVLSKLGIGDELAAKPIEVLNIPPYANWTDRGWNVRFRGNVHKFPDISQEKIDDLANDFLIGTEVSKLDAEGQAQARNLTRSIYVVGQPRQNVSMTLEPVSMQGDNTNTASGGSQSVKLLGQTTFLGDYEEFVTISQNGLLPGNETHGVQRLNVYANGTLSGNATAFLVPTEGITFISDIDDILRVTKIYIPKEGLLNSFARPFRQWENMPEIYANWSRTLPNNTHFHYLTTTIEQATRNYMDFIYKTYPGGSFDTRPLDFSDLSNTLHIRKHLLTRVFQTFPRRKFVLVGDTSNSDVMKAYPQLAHDYPDQVQCIFLRNTSATDSQMWFPYDTKHFKGLDSKRYMFFREPNDLAGLDIVNGQCLNETIPQNVTFNMQHDSAGGKR
ncbi:hypothetical protein BDU57DRAFT_548122 [Ampelomyces quisqualis]|uniref:Phosphatidate phosphatase APP1 catalytic domain-containing protein n=1 Tax=Ampelomyces quisqualis TaxID=50730 RepID=A0A6A5QPF7_AMPQU|nr:hypothetical protein BDU57DRAFT_548122 [Ampelomyces quisqualis]